MMDTRGHSSKRKRNDEQDKCKLLKSLWSWIWIDEDLKVTTTIVSLSLIIPHLSPADDGGSDQSKKKKYRKDKREFSL